MNLRLLCGSLMIMLCFVSCTTRGEDKTKQPKITIELKALTSVGTAKQPVKLALIITNRSKKTVTLVQPGDGSLVGWRTPVIQWHVNGQRSKLPPGRCGNVNPLRANEVFTLKPGEHKQLSTWIGAPWLKSPGKYQVSLRYTNDPKLKWRGLPLGKHDPDAMKKVRTSTAVTLQSNVVQVQIK